MRLPGRIAAAIEILREVETGRRPASEALKAWGTANRFAGVGDRAAIGNLVYDALRRRSSHAYAMQSEEPRALVLSVAVRDWGEDVDALSASFADDRFAPESISEAERLRLSAANAFADAPDHVLADVPEWTTGSMAAALGEGWVEQGKAMAERPPLDLRVNTLKSDRSRALRSLSRFNPASESIAPEAIRFPAGPRDARTPNVLTDEAYLKGWVEVQDQGSQLVALLAGAREGEQVLDLCAGAGGKTLAMAAAMNNKGQIFAYDSDRSRLAPIYDRLKRAGARNVQVRQPGKDVLDDLVGRLDRVVIDAPCTGSGTWRRRPDAKWKLTPAQLDQRVGEQAALVREAVRYLKPGGTLVYITCSILEEENDAQLRAAAGTDGLVAASGSSLWHRHVGPRARAIFTRAGGIQLTPLTTGTDGFYLAGLTRQQ